MPVNEYVLQKDKEYLKTIIENEGNAKRAEEKDKLGSTDFSAYIGQGHRKVKDNPELSAKNKERLENIYREAGVTKEEAKDLYGKEIVVGYGHTLLGKELKDYFTNEKIKQKFNNLSREQANILLMRDVKKHQNQVDELLKEKNIKTEDLSESQYKTLNEMGFQMGVKKLRDFKKMFKAIQEKNWEEAANQIRLGATPDSFSNLYLQTRKRAEKYMEAMKKNKETKTETPEAENSETIPSSVIETPTQKEVPADQAGSFQPTTSSLTYNTPQEETEAAFSKYFTAEESNLGKISEADTAFSKYFTDEETQQPTKEQPKIGQVEAAVGEFAHSATLGLTQKATAGLTWFSEGLNRMWPEEFGGQRKKEEDVEFEDAFKSETFKQAEQEYVDRRKAAREQWKKTTMAADLAGGVTSFLLPGSAVGRGVSLGKKILGGAALGAAEGSVRGGAESLARNKEDFFKDVAIGGLIGGGAGAALGGIAHGGGALWNRIRKNPIDSEDATKASLLLDEDATDVILVSAENRARKERDFNNAMLKSIKDISKASPKDQTKFLNITEKTAPKVIKQWEKQIDPKALAQYSKDEPLKIPNNIVKMGKKHNINPKTIHAYYNWRNDVFNYMKYINDIGERSKQTRESLLHSIETVQEVSKKTIKTEMPKFQKNIKAGLVNSESYSEFKTQQYLAEEMKKAEDLKVAAAQIGYGVKDQRLLKAVEAEAKEILANDPMQNVLFRKFATVSNAAELIDDRAKTNVLNVVQNLYVADKQKTGFTRAVSDLVKKTMKIREKPPYDKMTDEQIVRLIETGNKDQLADSYRNIFKYIREYANDRGLQIDEYRLGQDKYVSMKRKGAAELIENMGEVWKKATNELSIEEINNILKDRRKNPLIEKVEEAITKEAQIITDLRYLQNIAGETFNREILDFNMMKKAIDNLQSKESIRSLLAPSLRNVHERNGNLPMWARETDISKMAILDADNIGDLIFKRPVIDKLDTQIMLLKMKGFDNSADYLNNLKKDILGIYRKETEKRAIKSSLRELKWKGKPIGKLILGLENAVVSAIYPNYLGFNVRAIVRNLTQPYTMTTRELGIGPRGDLLALNASRKIIREGFAKAQKRYSKLGLVDERDPTSADFEGLKAGLRHYFKNNQMARKMDRFIDSYSDTAMAMYAKTDTINRLVTAQMSEDIAKALIRGKTNWIKNAPKQIQQTIKKQLDENASVDELTQTVGKWLQVKTQLNYAKDDMYEFGREMGPLFAMLSKWPTAVTSDIATKIMKDGRAGATRASLKYLAPWVLVAMVQNGLDKAVPADSVQSREMFGYGGLNSFLPASSVFGITDALIPIPIQSSLETSQGLLEVGTKGLTGRWDQKDTRKLGSVLTQTAEQFGPVVGGVMKTKRHLENITGQTDKKRKAKKRRKKYGID